MSSLDTSKFTPYRIGSLHANDFDYASHVGKTVYLKKSIHVSVNRLDCLLVHSYDEKEKRYKMFRRIHRDDLIPSKKNKDYVNKLFRGF